MDRAVELPPVFRLVATNIHMQENVQAPARLSLLGTVADLELRPTRWECAARPAMRNGPTPHPARSSPPNKRQPLSGLALPGFGSAVAFLRRTDSRVRRESLRRVDARLRIPTKLQRGLDETDGAFVVRNRRAIAEMRWIRMVVDASGVEPRI